MKAIILVILLIFLIGCNSNIPIPCDLGWENETHYCNEFHYPEKKQIQIIEKEIIKVCPDCICKTQNIPDCICKPPPEKECKTDIKTIIAPGCTNKLTLCNARLEYKDKQIYDLMIENNTEHSEGLRINLTRCERTLNDTNNKIRELFQ